MAPAMSRGGNRPPRHIRPVLHGGVSRQSRFRDFLSCESIFSGRVAVGTKETNSLSTFVWPSSSSRTSAISLSKEAVSPQMLSALASAAAAFGGAPGGDAMMGEVSMACLPFIAPGWSSEDNARETDGLSERARNLQRGLAATCFAQATCATLNFTLNDGISGLIGCAIATLGLQASTPSGYRFLPSYIVLAFCNGTMQVLIGTEVAAHAAALTHAAAGVKLASVVAVASPALMFVGLAVAWHLHCELRALALQALPPSMRSGLAMPPPVDGVIGAPTEGAIGQGAGVTSLGGPFRPFAGQSHRLEEAK